MLYKYLYNMQNILMYYIYIQYGQVVSPVEMRRLPQEISVHHFAFKRKSGGPAKGISLIKSPFAKAKHAHVKSKLLA